ncbi:MAG: hypothetical protein JWN75_1248 [Candidatus Saccharibacteria bacterium]|nr:hypothetical protein [Candidatus Saccharibacteria bacterium]
MENTMEYSPQQAAWINWVKTGTGNALMRARAGTGKTFTLIEGMPYMGGRVAYCVFNKKMEMEARSKIENKGLRHIVAGTFHKFGYDALRQAYPKAGKPTGLKILKLCDAMKVPELFHPFVRAAVSLAKQRGFGIGTGTINNPADWINLVEHFDLDQTLGEGNFLDREELIREGLRWSCKVLKQSIMTTAECIDFDDMIYMPLIDNLRMPSYDWVLVDEGQDSNPVRRALARKMLKPGGRAGFVGDDWQSIYGFTGADNDALDQIARDFNTAEFPLTVTYRCQKVVVELAKEIVADYEAHESAPEGEHIKTDLKGMYDAELKPGDAILCRNTGPLVDVAFNLIRRGITCHVEGRDIGAGLIKIVARWPKIKTLSAFLDKLEKWQESEIEKFMTAGAEDKADSLNDKVETIQTLARMMPPGATVANLAAKIESMFADTPEGERAPGVLLMTAHRSKGLEFPRVFLLGRNRYMPSRFARQAWQMKQEKALEYVAITRAMETLVDVFIELPKPKKQEEEDEG